MSESIEVFWETVDRVYGAYLDANAGFNIFRERIAQMQVQTITSLGLSQEHIDTLDFFYGRGNPNDPSSRVQHQVSQGQLKHRNRKNGENALFLGAMSLVAIYQFWEDRFRAEVASELGISRQHLQHDLLGDIRLIRIAIIHHGGVAKKEIEKCILLKWFNEGDEILIDDDRMEELITRLREVCLAWVALRQANQSNLQPQYE